jgi:hypothetical protein
MGGRREEEGGKGMGEEEEEGRIGSKSEFRLRSAWWTFLWRMKSSEFPRSCQGGTTDMGKGGGRREEEGGLGRKDEKRRKGKRKGRKQ